MPRAHRTQRSPPKPTTSIDPLPPRLSLPPFEPLFGALVLPSFPEAALQRPPFQTWASISSFPSTATSAAFTTPTLPPPSSTTSLTPLREPSTPPKRPPLTNLTSTPENPALPPHLSPKQWPQSRKRMTLFILSLTSLTVLSVASSPAPALPLIARNLQLSPTATQLVLTSYFLGLAFGPLLSAPLSEHFGRRPLYRVCTAVFVVANALCPVGGKLGLMVIGRIVAGMSGGSLVVLGVCIVGDVYEGHQRGRGLAIVSAMAYLGPAIGPIVGGLCVRGTGGWGWGFWVFSLWLGAVGAVGYFVVEESCEVFLKQRLTGDSKGGRREVFRGMGRPISMLIKRPSLQVVAAMYGLNFGVYVILLTSFATLWIDSYGMSEATASLHYIAIAIGATVAAQLGARLMDWTWKRLCRRYGKGVPEFRMPALAIASAITPCGLLWYGWSAQGHAHWLTVDIGAAVLCIGSFLASQVWQTFILDEYGGLSASASAAMRMLGYVAGFAFPLFAPQLYKTLGYGWGNSLLALISAMGSLPVPFLIWRYGRRLRAVRLWSKEDGKSGSIGLDRLPGA